MTQLQSPPLAVGNKLCRIGDHEHLWIIESIIPAEAGKPAFAVLVRDDGLSAEDIDLNYLGDPELYIPI